MTSVRHYLMPRSYRNDAECSPRELTFGRRFLFHPLDPQKPNPNRKYMFPHDQFRNRPGPILRFFASWDDRGEPPRDRMRFRNCQILYYVEDGTIKVYEPRQKNSGLEQGYIVNRQKIPKPDGEFYTLDELNVGRTLVFFGKRFKILDCDPFTRNYLQEMGYQVGSPEPGIQDPVYADRMELDVNKPYMLKPKESRASKRFYKYHPKKLRFYVIYNSTPHFFQEKCTASMYYDLVDHKIKIVDDSKVLDHLQQLEIGNFDSCVILRPVLVPKKDLGPSPITGSPHAPLILNLSAESKSMHLHELMSCRSGGGNNPRVFLRDPNPAELSDRYRDFYTAKDLDLGMTINVFGVDVYIYDCDEFTKEFYRNELGREMVPVRLPDVGPTMYHTLVCKDDFLNNETNLQTVRDLSPAVPPWKSTSDVLAQITDFAVPKANMLSQFRVDSREGFETKVLSFLSKIVTEDVFLKDVYFVIQFFLEDSTVRVNCLNTKFDTSDSKHGLFFRRARLAKPRPADENSGISFNKSEDFFVGNVIYITKKAFVIVDADEYTYDYMERRCDAFPNSNIKDILARIFPSVRDRSTELSKSFEQRDPKQTGFVPYKDFRDVLLFNLPQDLKPATTEHQLRTIARHFAAKKYIGLDVSDLLSRVQAELKRQQFSDFKELGELFQIHELEKDSSSGLLEPDTVYKVLLSYPLKIEKDLLKSLIFKYPKCSGLVCYRDLVKAINYFDNPLEPPSKNPSAIDINWERVEWVKDMVKISYREFLKDLVSPKCPNC